MTRRIVALGGVVVFLSVGYVVKFASGTCGTLPLMRVQPKSSGPGPSMPHSAVEGLPALRFEEDHLNITLSALKPLPSSSPRLFVPHWPAEGLPALKFKEGHFDIMPGASFKNAKGNRIPFMKELAEHSMLVKYLQPSATVFELGSRYGSSSCVVAWIQENSGRLVSAEGDADVWRAQAQNMENLNCKNYIWRGFVSRKRFKKSKKKNGSEWTTKFEVVERKDEAGAAPSITFSDLQTAAGMQFDTFLVDCEGCFDNWLQEFPDAVDTVSTILLEADYGIGWQRQGYANYTRVKAFLGSKGFTIAEQTRIKDDLFKKGGRIDFIVFIRAKM